jgi:serine/threonine protein phosphatase PrpC
MPFIASGAWICHAGKLRKVNEDSCLFGGTFSGASTSVPLSVRVPGDQWIVAVSDGIGGHRAGAYASREVVYSLSNCIQITPEGIHEALEGCNKRLHDASLANDDLAKCGATVAGLFAGNGDTLYAFNIGDARLYRQEGGKLRLITQDDSVEQMLIAEGLLEASHGIRPASLHALTQSIGGTKELISLNPHFHPLPMANRARFLLCTDGLTDSLSHGDMERLVVPILGAAAAAQTLFSAAMQAGGKDNITIAVVDVERSVTL